MVLRKPPVFFLPQHKEKVKLNPNDCYLHWLQDSNPMRSFFSSAAAVILAQYKKPRLNQMTHTKSFSVFSNLFIVIAHRVYIRQFALHEK